MLFLKITARSQVISMDILDTYNKIDWKNKLTSYVKK